MKEFKNQLSATEQVVGRGGYLTPNGIAGIIVENMADYLIEDKGDSMYPTYVNFWEVLECSKAVVDQQVRVNKNTCKLLEGHPSYWSGSDSKIIVGNVGNLVSTGKEIMADFDIDEETDMGMEVVKKLDQGITLPTSIGYEPKKGRIEKIDKDSQLAIIRIYEWELIHIALVSQGADASTLIKPPARTS